MKRTILFAVIALAAFMQSHALAQSDSRRLQLDEAEQLALDAQTLNDESVRLQARKQATTAASVHAAAVNSMSLAIDIWERLHVPDLVGAGLTELSNLQMSSGDVEASIATNHRLIDHWHVHGDPEREGWANFELASRLATIQERTEALARWEQTIAFAKAHRLDDVYANALSQEAILLKLLGRSAEAELAEQSASQAMAELMGSMHQPLAEPELAQLPEGWIDVPTSPLVAELKAVNARSHLVLTNHDAKSISSVTLGCVVESHGRWRLLRGLFGLSIMDATVASGSHFDITRDFAGTRDRWTDRPMGCQEGRPGVVETGFFDGTGWRLPS